MKPYIVGLILCASIALITVGCELALHRTAKENSLPVITGAATTNDVNAVAYLELLKKTNTSLNPTPTAQPINMALDGLIALAAAGAGWYARHRTATVQAAATLKAVEKTAL